MSIYENFTFFYHPHQNPSKRLYTKGMQEIEDALHPTLTLTTSYTGHLLENVSISNSSIFDKKKRFTPTSHSKRWKSPAVKALRPVRGAYDISLASHCPLTYQEIKLYLSC